MILYPAVDLQSGRAVRLRQGERDRETVFAVNPLEAAQNWINQGARWLHVIDLDGAFDGLSANDPVLRDLARLPVPIQVGGGIRDMNRAEYLLDMGVARLIIGTIALENPALFREMARTFPGRVGVSLDARDGVLKTRGWINSSSLTARDVLPRLEDDGAAFIVYTDIERDGELAGLNADGLRDVLRATSLPVIAAGGAATLADVRAVGALKPEGNLDGIISGRALYAGTLSLPEAQSLLDDLS